MGGRRLRRSPAIADGMRCMMSEFDRDGFEEVPIGDSELPPVPPEFEDAASAPPMPADTGGPLSISSEERGWAIGAHASAFLTFVVPIPGISILAPLIIWLMKKDTMPYVDYHGKEAVNFNISFFIWFIVALIVGLALFLVGAFLTIPIVGITWFVLVIIGAVKASNGEYYRYPFTIRLVN